MTEILRMSECYEGKDPAEGCWVFGDEGTLISDGLTDVEWSQDHWDEVSGEFFLNLQEDIERYEKRYRTTVEKIAMVGRLGLWHGRPIGGTMLSKKVNPLNKLSDMNEIVVRINNDHQFEISGSHHDGTHEFQLYFITPGIAKRNNIDMHNPIAHDMELIFNRLKPFKLSTHSLEYYGIKQPK